MHHPTNLIARVPYILATILITLLTTTSLVVANTSRADLIKVPLSPDQHYSFEAHISGGMHLAVMNEATAESLIALLSQQLNVYSYADTDRSPLSLDGFKAILTDSAIILNSVNQIDADDLLEVRKHKVLIIITPPTENPDGQKKIISIEPHLLQQIHKELAASLDSVDSGEPSASERDLESFLSAVSEHIHHRSFGSASLPSHSDETPLAEDSGEVTNTDASPTADNTSEDEEGLNLFSIQAFVGDLMSHQNLSYQAGEDLMAKLVALPSFNLSFEPVSYFNQMKFMDPYSLDQENLAIQFLHTPPAGKIAFITYSQKLMDGLNDSGHITPNDHLALLHISIDDFLKTIVTHESFLSMTEMSKTELFLAQVYLDVIATKNNMEKQAEEKAKLNEENKEKEGGDTLPDSSTDVTSTDDNSTASNPLTTPMDLEDNCLKIRRNHKPIPITAEHLSSTSFADYRRTKDIARRNKEAENTLASAQKALVKQTLNALLFSGGNPARNVTVKKQASGTIIKVCSHKAP